MKPFCVVWNGAFFLQSLRYYYSIFFSEKIKDLLPQGSIDEITKLVLVNAIYFKGNWEEKFPKEDTRDEQFKLNKVRFLDLAELKYLKWNRRSFDIFPLMHGRVKLNQWRWWIRSQGFLCPSSRRWTVRFWSCRMSGRISVCWSSFLTRLKTKPLAFRRWDSTDYTSFSFSFHTLKKTKLPKVFFCSEALEELCFGLPKNLSVNRS